MKNEDTQVSKFEGVQDSSEEESPRNSSLKSLKAKDSKQLTGLDHELNEKVKEFKKAYNYKYDQLRNNFNIYKDFIHERDSKANMFHVKEVHELRERILDMESIASQKDQMF